jgi:hypothetical protein
MLILFEILLIGVQFCVSLDGGAWFEVDHATDDLN